MTFTDTITLITTLPLVALIYLFKYCFIPFAILMLLLSPIMPFIEYMNWRLDPRINK
jgi:hypothetical protein